MNKKNEIGGTIQEYDVGEQLGRGGFATVYRARCRNTGRDVAIKKINKSEIAAGGLINRVRQEVTIHSKLNHPAILKLYAFFEDQSFVYLVLELCSRGELQKHIKSLRRVLNEDEAREYLSQVVAGMLYLHSQSIMHRDLTLSNLLLDNNGRVKIADFGLATQLRRPDDRHMTMCGTPNYISPEVATRSSHGLESDVWSLGCMLFIMLVGHPPFDGEGVKESIFTRVVIGDYKIPSYVTANARSLISECLKKNPRERIKLQAIPHHPFMAVGGKTDISRTSDSGLYTMTTVATTQHTRPPLTTISESDLSDTESSGSENRQGGHHHRLPYLRHPPSPPIRMKSNPKDLLPPNAGVIDTLKRKFTPLPSLQRGDFGHSNMPMPPLIRRERDVSEERQKHQLMYSQKQSSHSDDRSDSSQYSSSHMSDEAYHYHSGEKRSSRTRDHSASRSQDYHSAGRSPSRRERSHERYGSAHREVSDNYRIHSDTEEAKERGGHPRSRSKQRSYCQDYPQKSEKGNRDAYHSEERKEHYRYGRPSERHDERPHREHSGHRHRESSKDRYSERNRDDEYQRNRSRERHQHYHSEKTNRRRDEEPYNQKTHPCCESSQHRSWCKQKGRNDSEKNVSNYERSRYTSRCENDRYGASDRVHVPSQHRHTQHEQPVRAEGSSSRDINILGDLAPVKNSVQSKKDSEDARPGHGGTVHEQHPVTPTKRKPDLNCQTLKQQVSPLSSRRLKPIRQRTKNAFLNILENGEICLEFLRNMKGQEVVADVCRISPDGMRIVLYQPNGGSGLQPGSAPPPLPTEGADSIYGYENLPAKHWKKYVYAARFVKVVKAKTPKITYYSDQAKCLLMENSPDPDCEAIFYHGTKITKSGKNVMLTETTGVVHKIPQPSGHHNLPEQLQPIYLHFKQIHEHCLYLERVLSEVVEKTGLGCFPIIVGRKPASVSATPPSSARSSSSPREDKENLSPVSVQSYKLPRNVAAQLGSFEGSVASVQVEGNFVPRLRAPLNPHIPRNDSKGTTGSSKHSVSRVYVHNIGWASQDEEGQVSVEYLDGTQLQVSSNSPKVVFTDASGVSATYSSNDKLPLSVQQKLSQMQVVLTSLARPTDSSATPRLTHPVGLR
ncbi:serine/threonine-protein kinase PLK4 [Penaeus vannamei]|uniref:serine/threonine-protein kinase PLK4 n=1 Tax=Penaeus vannamei TaxID=6689 RepID=UPI00387F98A3